jgi:hypothetical protein
MDTISGKGVAYFEEDIDTEKDCVRRWKRHLRMTTLIIIIKGTHSVELTRTRPERRVPENTRMN